MTYIARYWCGTSRKFKAKHARQALYIAKGIGASNNWTLKSVGKA